MKKGYYHGDTPSGNARKISAEKDGAVKVLLVPVSATRYFRKLPHPPGTFPVPCILEVKDWLLEKDPAVAALPEAQRGRDYQ